MQLCQSTWHDMMNAHASIRAVLTQIHPGPCTCTRRLGRRKHVNTSATATYHKHAELETIRAAAAVALVRARLPMPMDARV